MQLYFLKYFLTNEAKVTSLEDIVMEYDDRFLKSMSDALIDFKKELKLLNLGQLKLHMRTQHKFSTSENSITHLKAKNL